MYSGIPLDQYLREHGTELEILEYKYEPTAWNNNTGYIFAMTAQHRIAMMKDIAKKEDLELQLVLQFRKKEKTEMLQGWQDAKKVLPKRDKQNRQWTESVILLDDNHKCYYGYCVIDDRQWYVWEFLNEEFITVEEAAIGDIIQWMYMPDPIVTTPVDIRIDGE